MARFASRATRSLYSLATTLAAHEALGIEALSGRASGKGGVFAKFGRGQDCRTATAERLLAWFDQVWPSDLAWPEDVIARPSGPRLVAPTSADMTALATADIWSNGRRPTWWADLEVRAFLMGEHRQMSCLRAAAIGKERFGSRSPKKSAINDFWQRLDRLAANKTTSTTDASTAQERP